MLIAMTYQVELLLYLLGGFFCGYFVFNVRQPVNETADPCCAHDNSSIDVAGLQGGIKGRQRREEAYEAGKFASKMIDLGGGEDLESSPLLTKKPHALSLIHISEPTRPY